MANSYFKQDEIILLLGAGASVEAGIPDSRNMIGKIEELTTSENEWGSYRELYWYIRSSIFFADGLDGKFDKEVHFNIERLVHVLDELRKKERHALYPFVGAWSPKLLEVAGADFKNIRQFHEKIVRTLRNQWVTLSKVESADYYKCLLRFQEDYTFPLRVFSLNYDLCIEKACGEAKVQRGFAERTWDWRVFDESPDSAKSIILYKLHGSLDWCFVDGQVQFSDSPSTIKDEDVALIFGTPHKLQYLDPFLFLAYELRRRTLDVARIIVCVGYGFNDDHINDILGQSLRQDENRRLLAVTGPGNSSEDKQLIISRLQVQDSQVSVDDSCAKDFLERKLTIDALEDLVMDQVDLYIKHHPDAVKDALDYFDELPDDYFDEPPDDFENIAF